MMSDIKSVEGSQYEQALKWYLFFILSLICLHFYIKFLGYIQIYSNRFIVAFTVSQI